MKWLILGVVAVIFIGTLIFLYRKSQDKPVVYQLDSPVKMAIIKKTVATGKVIPRREIEVKSQVSGVVEKLYVVAGHVVKKGATIARISLRQVNLTIDAAEAASLPEYRGTMGAMETNLRRSGQRWKRRLGR